MQVDGGQVAYVTELDFYATAQYNDETTDTMYYVPEIPIVRLMQDGSKYPDRSGVRLTEAGGNRLLE